MNKKLVGLLGVVSAAVSLDAAQASPAQPQHAVVDTALAANSFADLLAPIPNAVALLKSSDAALAQQDAEAQVELAQYYYPYHHHHHHRFYHHHHHRFFRYHHHHHHHRYYSY